ncbi:hypothetical protein DRQ07_09080, partial [candidate division KSB1 bacterium]
MLYLLDTVTIIRHFSDIGNIGKKAREILNQKSNNFMISVISLMEIMYLAEKNRIDINLMQVLEKIESSSLYSIVDLTPEILIVAEKTPFFELHDRLILSTARLFEIPVISSDKRFNSV